MSAIIWASMPTREPGLYWIITSKRSFSLCWIHSGE